MTKNQGANRRKAYGRASTLRWIRFAVVGCGVNIAAYITYIFLTGRRLDPLKAASLVFIIFTAISFKGHSRITFGQKNSRKWCLAIYYVAAGVSWALNIVALKYFAVERDIDHRLVQAVSSAMLAGCNYLVLRWMVGEKR